MKVKELLTDESKWTNTYAARNPNGEPCDSCSTSAVCWCLYGATQKCYPRYDEWMPVVDKIRKYLKANCDGCAIGTWNDNHSFQDVLALVKQLDI